MKAIFLFFTLQKLRNEESNERLVANLKSEKEELESLLSKEKLQSVQLKQELADAETRNAELYKVSWLFKF